MIECRRLATPAAKARLARRAGSWEPARAGGLRAARAGWSRARLGEQAITKQTAMRDRLNARRAAARHEIKGMATGGRRSVLRQEAPGHASMQKRPSQDAASYSSVLQVTTAGSQIQSATAQWGGIHGGRRARQ